MQSHSARVSNQFMLVLLLAGCSSARHDAPPTRRPAPMTPYVCAKYHLDATPTDSDGDGVPDAIDACPCSPGPNMPDDTDAVRGCPWDAPPRPHP